MWSPIARSQYYSCSLLYRWWVRKSIFQSTKGILTTSQGQKSERQHELLENQSSVKTHVCASMHLVVCQDLTLNGFWTNSSLRVSFLYSHAADKVKGDWDFLHLSDTGPYSCAARALTHPRMHTYTHACTHYTHAHSLLSWRETCSKCRKFFLRM